MTIRLVADAWKRVRWWFCIGPRLIVYRAAIFLGFYAEEFDDDE